MYMYSKNVKIMILKGNTHLKMNLAKVIDFNIKFAENWT